MSENTGSWRVVVAPGVEQAAAAAFFNGEGAPLITAAETPDLSTSGRHALDDPSRVTINVPDSVLNTDQDRSQPPVIGPERRGHGWGEDAATKEDTQRWFAHLEGFGDDQPDAGEPETPVEAAAAPAAFDGDDAQTTFTHENQEALNAMLAADAALNPPSNPVRETDVLTRTALREYAAQQQAAGASPDTAADPGLETAIVAGFLPEADVLAIEAPGAGAPIIGPEAPSAVWTEPEAEPKPMLHIGALGSMALAEQALRNYDYNGVVVTNPDQKIPMPASEHDERVAGFNTRVMPPAWRPDHKDLYGYPAA